MKNTLVSIILPVFKANPDFFEQSVQSILSQTYKEIELIVILDRCNQYIDDLVLSIFEQFRDDHRLRLVVNKKRLGFTYSLNKGIRMAKGEFIGRMDADDVSLPNRIEEQITLLLNGKYDIIGCWSHVIDNHGKLLGFLSPPTKWQTIRKYLLLYNPFIHSSLIFRREVIRTIGLYRPDFEPSEDYEFYLRAFSKGFRGTNVPSYLHSWRKHSSLIMYSNRWKENRLEYLRCKLFAVFKYGYNRPFDIIFLGITPLSIMVPPSKVLYIKRILGILKNQK